MKLSTAKLSTVVLAGMLAVIAAAPAGADTTGVDGSWWSRANTGVPVSLPVSPPAAPVSTQLMVQQLPDGPAAVTAIMLPVAAGTTPTVLTVHLSAPGETVTLSGCAALAPWVSANGGVWTSRPQCNGTPVPLVVSPDATTATLDVTRIDQTTIQRSGSLEVLLQPADGSSSFSVSLTPPVVTDLTSRPADGPGQSPATTQPAPPADSTPVGVSPATTGQRPATSSPRTGPGAAAPGPGQPSAGAAGQAPSTAGPAGAAPLPAGANPPAAVTSGTLIAGGPPVVSDAAGPQPELPPAPATDTAGSPVNSALALPTTHTNRRLPILLFVVLALLVVAVFPIQTRGPQLLTSRGVPSGVPFSNSTQAGLGRHRQQRTGRPPRL